MILLRLRMVEMVTQLRFLQEKIKEWEDRYNTLKRNHGFLLREMIEIKEIARGTINADEASKQDLMAALCLMRNDRDSYHSAYLRSLGEIRFLEEKLAKKERSE